MLRSSWLWSDCRYRVVVGLIYDPGHLWPESTHDLIWGSCPVYAWPLTKRGPTSSIVCSKDLLRWHPQRALPAQCTRVRALERPSVLYLVHWKDPPGLIFMRALWSPCGRVQVKRRDPSYSCLYMIFLPFLLCIRMKRCWLKHKNTLRFGNRFWINGEVGAKVESWL